MSFPYIYPAGNPTAIYGGHTIQCCHILWVDISNDMYYDIYISRGNELTHRNKRMVVTGQYLSV